MNAKKTVIICSLILVSAAGATGLIFWTEPSAERSGATKQTAMLVEVTGVERGTFRPEIVAMGTVEAAQDIILSPRVGGLIIERSPSFTPGGLVAAGETLLKIDPADFESALAQHRSMLREATAELQLEMGRQDVAQQGYQLLEQELSPENEALVLRAPQLNTARARVEAARAAVAQAELQLERTAVKAPFAARIISREVNVGSQVAPGDPLARLVGLEEYWISTAVPLAKLRWISVPETPDGTGSSARIRNRGAWPEGVFRAGHVGRLVGTLEANTRMARLLVTVPDPLAREANSRPGDETPALMLGAFVEVRIEGRALSKVVRLNRDYIRSNDTVWLMEEDKLRIRNVDIMLRDARYAYIAGGLDDGDLVVTTNLSMVTDGAPLRLSTTAVTESADGDAGT